MLGRRGAEVAAQKLVDSGDAATLKEAYSLQARIGARAAAQKRVDSGEAATLQEGYSLQGRKGAEVAAQKLVDSGEAATLEEAWSMLGRRGAEVAVGEGLRQGRQSPREVVTLCLEGYLDDFDRQREEHLVGIERRGREADLGHLLAPAEGDP